MGGTSQSGHLAFSKTDWGPRKLCMAPVEPGAPGISFDGMLLESQGPNSRNATPNECG